MRRYLYLLLSVFLVFLSSCNATPDIYLNREASSLQNITTSTDSIFFDYSLSVVNDSDKDMSFFIIAEMRELYNSDIIGSPMIYAQDAIGDRKLFSVLAGETQVFNCIFESSYIATELPSDIDLPDAVIFHIYD